MLPDWRNSPRHTWLFSVTFTYHSTDFQIVHGIVAPIILSVMSHLRFCRATLTRNVVAGLTRRKLRAALYSGNELRNSATRHVTPANLSQESKLRDKVSRCDITLRFPKILLLFSSRLQRPRHIAMRCQRIRCECGGARHRTAPRAAAHAPTTFS